MNVLEGVGWVGPQAPAPRPPSARGPSFPLAPRQGSEATGVAASASAGSLSIVLALDAEEERGARDRRARRRGQDLLAALAQVQRGLLEYAGPGAGLAALRSLLIELPDADNPGLAAALQAIALRCRIELARRETGRTNP